MKRMSKEQEKRFAELKAYLLMSEKKELGQVDVDQEVERIKDFLSKNPDLEPFVDDEINKMGKRLTERCKKCPDYQECLKDKDTRAYLFTHG